MPGGGEEAVVPLYQVVGAQHPLEVVAECLGRQPLLVVAGEQATLQLAFHALQGGRSDDPFGRAADPEQDVGTGLGPGGGDGARHVPVGDQPDPGPDRPEFLDQVLVPRPVEDDRGHVADRFALGLGHGLDVVGRGLVEADLARGLGADRDLLHVHARPGVEHGSPLAHRDHGQRPAPAEGGQRGPVDGIHRDVGQRGSAIADLLAVEKHRRLVLLALADDHHPVHGHARQNHPHGVHRRPVGALLVAAAHPPRRSHSRGLRDPDQFHGQVAIGSLGMVASG